MVDKSQVSGIVLAGGMSRRLGRNKALEPIGGEPLVCRVIRRLSSAAGQIVVVVNDERRALELPLPPTAKVVQDAYPGRWLAGRHLHRAEGRRGSVGLCGGVRHAFS